MQKILTIIGARPQFVKASVVSRALKARGIFNEIIVHTGQHYDRNMSDIFFTQLDVPEPAYNLAIGSGSHAAQTGRMLEGIEGILLDEKPQAVLVYGDTNSTLAGALAAVKLQIPVIHVEAGLRSFNRRMPEEINRIATDAVSSLLLAPTPTAAARLKEEGVPDAWIVWTGDVMYDAVLTAAEIVKAGPSLLPPSVPRREYLLCTIHRAENTDDPERLGWIVETLTKVAAEIPIVLPLHPRTRGALERYGLMQHAQTLNLTEPVGYLEMIQLMQGARAILTDSGGLQKEAFFLKKPVYVFRRETEWIELIQTGWAQLLDQASNSDSVLCAEKILAFKGFERQLCPAFGSGKAGFAVARAMEDYLVGGASL
jgi:UDP-GlcNAc3NAcA epimerase